MARRRKVWEEGFIIGTRVWRDLAMDLRQRDRGRTAATGCRDLELGCEAFAPIMLEGSDRALIRA
jgi:hypothetical protein